MKPLIFHATTPADPVAYAHFYVGGPRSRKYHAIPHCDGLNATWTASGTSGTSLIFLISRVDAIGRGLEPCQKCSPPPLLWRVS